MVDSFDMLQCPVCKTYYVPKTTVTGRLISHCVTPLEEGMKRVWWLDGEVEWDYSAMEARVVKHLLTEDVVDPPLTGSLLDIKV